MDGECENMKLLKREIEKKINSYKSQDITKKIYNELILISLSDTIEKLVCSKLKCHYCKENVLLFYKNVRDSKQWTLDRIDNDLCHSNENTLIACLHCNLQRRTRDMEKFLFTKQLKIKKQD
jgi:precorrin-3B methylase